MSRAVSGVPTWGSRSASAVAQSDDTRSAASFELLLLAGVVRVGVERQERLDVVAAGHRGGSTDASRVPAHDVEPARDVRRERLVAEELETRPARAARIGQQRADPVAGGRDAAKGEVDLWTVRIAPVERNR